jgi:hypothetical protein
MDNEVGVIYNLLKLKLMKRHRQGERKKKATRDLCTSIKIYNLYYTLIHIHTHP